MRRKSSSGGTGERLAKRTGASDQFPLLRLTQSESADAPALLVDSVSGCIQDANPAALSLLATTLAGIAGERFPDLIEARLVDDADGAAFYRFVTRGGTFYYGLSCVPILGEGRRAELYLFNDVTRWVELQTELTDRNLELSHLARHDHLTDLFNRHMFQDTLELASARLERIDGHLGVLYIDLDGFKQVNDRLGHDVGDSLLQEVARRLRRAVRTSDMAARLGGDEFGVILENLREPADALKVAGHIIEVLSQPYDIDGEAVRISASVGAATAGQPPANVADLVTRADRMMFQAKSNGPGRAALCAGGAAARKRRHRT